MDLVEQFLFSPSITQSLLWLTIVMTIGLWLGEKAKIKQFSLGVTWVLFVGIALASCGIKIDHHVAQFAKDFGLILFVYSIGLQVGCFKFTGTIADEDWRLSANCFSMSSVTVFVPGINNMFQNKACKE